MYLPFSSANFSEYTGGLNINDVQSVTFLGSCAEAPKYAWDISADKNRSVLAWAKKNGSYYDVYVAGNGGINAEKACPYLFYDCRFLKRINFGTAFHTEYATSMHAMFADCVNLTYLDVSHLDTSKVSDMSMMFYGCRKLTIYGINIWDVSNVSSYGLFMPEAHTINGRPWKEFFS